MKWVFKRHSVNLKTSLFALLVHWVFWSHTNWGGLPGSDFLPQRLPGWGDWNLPWGLLPRWGLYKSVLHGPVLCEGLSNCFHFHEVLQNFKASGHKMFSLWNPQRFAIPLHHNGRNTEFSHDFLMGFSCLNYSAFSCTLEFSMSLPPFSFAHAWNELSLSHTQPTRAHGPELHLEPISRDSQMEQIPPYFRQFLVWSHIL